MNQADYGKMKQYESSRYKLVLEPYIEKSWNFENAEQSHDLSLKIITNMSQ